MSFLSPLFIGITGVFALLTPLSYSGHKGLFRFVNIDMTGGGYDSILPVIIKFSAILGLIYFLRKDLADIFKGAGSLLKDIKEKNFDIGSKDFLKKLVLMMVFGCFTFVIAPLVKFLTKDIGAYLPVIFAGFLISFYFVLRAEKVKEKTLKESNETILNGILVSVFNSFSYIPGISGVGGMYFAGILSGFRREFVVKYAYLITLLWTSLSFIYDIAGFFSSKIIINFGVFSYILAFIGTIGVSIYVPKLFDYSVRNRKMTGFAFYNAVIAVITLIIWIRG